MGSLSKYIILASIMALALTYIYAVNYVSYPIAKELPLLTLYSLARISIVFVISFVFGLITGILAATNKVFGRMIIPVFDILQSVPILGYFPILLIGLIVLFPGVVGRELAVMVLLFTAMEWSIFFGVVGAVKAIPQSVTEAARSFGLGGFSYLRHVILPAIMPSLISASTLAWNDGWTFDIAAEYVNFGNNAYTVSGLGSFIYTASNIDTNIGAAWVGLLVIGEVVILTNQLIWHKVADNIARHKGLITFHFERFGYPLRSIRAARRLFGLKFRVEILHRHRMKHSFSTRWIAISFFLALIIAISALYLGGSYPQLQVIASSIPIDSIAITPLYALFTLLRLFITYLVCIIVSVSIALLAVQRKGFIKYFYTIYDIGRAIPYLALFPPLFATLRGMLPGNMSLEVSSYFLLFMGMIWYILYNVVTAASYLPSELKDVASIFRIRGFEMIRSIIVPAIMPAMITGSILAWGGGWNVIIYSEYVKQDGNIFSLPGLGFLISEASDNGNIGLVIFYLFVMSGIVILIGRLVWRRLLHRVERYGVELS